MQKPACGLRMHGGGSPARQLELGLLYNDRSSGVRGRTPAPTRDTTAITRRAMLRVYNLLKLHVFNERNIAYNYSIVTVCLSQRLAYVYSTNFDTVN